MSADVATTEQSIAMYTTAITTVVVIDVTFSLTTSVASSAMGASGNPMTRGGGVLPLIFGVQRMSLSSGLAVPTSGTDAGVSGAMGWASGDFGIVGQAGMSSTTESIGAGLRRRLFGQAEFDAMYASLLSKLSLCGVVLACVALFELLVLAFWKCRMNRRYYKELPAIKAVHAIANDKSKSFLSRSKSSAQLKLMKTNSVKFRALPGIFVFPNLLLIASKFFITGLVSGATGLLANADLCTGACRVWSIATLVAVAGYVLWGWVVIAYFSRRFRVASYKRAPPPRSSDAAKDPLFRCLNRLRTWLSCGQFDNKHTITDRMQGKFSKPKEWTEEPARTERLLAKPLQPQHSNPADIIDAYQMTYFAMANGRLPITPYVNHFQMTTQLTIAVLSGLGSAISEGSSHATLQVAAIASFQAVFALYCLAFFPTCDKADSAMFGLQFLLEGVRTFLLLVATQQVLPTRAATLRENAFLLSLVALAVPLVRKLYDAIIVQLINLHRGGKLNRKQAGLALLMFLTALQSAITGLVGVPAEARATINSASSGALLSAKLAKRGTDQAVVLEMLEAASSIADDIFALNAANAGVPDNTAATTIQKHWRGLRARLILQGRLRAASPLNAQQRPGLEWLAMAMESEELERRKGSKLRSHRPVPRGLPHRVHPQIYDVEVTNAAEDYPRRLPPRPLLPWLIHPPLEPLPVQLPLSAARMPFPGRHPLAPEKGDAIHLARNPSRPNVKRTPLPRTRPPPLIPPPLEAVPMPPSLPARLPSPERHPLAKSTGDQKKKPRSTLQGIHRDAESGGGTTKKERKPKAKKEVSMRRNKDGSGDDIGDEECDDDFCLDV